MVDNMSNSAPSGTYPHIRLLTHEQPHMPKPTTTHKVRGYTSSCRNVWVNIWETSSKLNGRRQSLELRVLMSELSSHAQVR